MRLLRVEAFVGDDARHRQVVGVADPADGVGVLAMAVRELRRTPAVDWLADELLGAHEEPEADQDDDRVLATQQLQPRRWRHLVTSGQWCSTDILPLLRAGDSVGRRGRRRRGT